MTVWVGLTGGIGSGKSAATDLFLDLGVVVIDADAISRQLTAKNGAALDQIEAQFGPQAIAGQELNRSYMRELVFSHPAAKMQLEAILHPLIVANIRQLQQQVNAVYAVADIPLLTELPLFQELVQRVLVIDCTEATQINRVMRRSGLSREQITAIMAQQATREQRQALADDVVCNEDSLEAFQQRILNLHQHYLQLFKTV